MMKSNMNLSILFFVVELILFSYGEVEQCYSCAMCSDPLDTSIIPKVDCKTVLPMVDGKFSCYKAVATRGGATGLFRGCLNAKLSCQNKEEIEKTLNVKIDECSTCDDNLCNSAMSMYLSVPFSIVAIVLMSLF